MVPKLFECSTEISYQILSPIQLKWHKSQQSSILYSLVNCIRTFDCNDLISYELVQLFGITVQIITHVQCSEGITCNAGP